MVHNFFVRFLLVSILNNIKKVIFETLNGELTFILQTLFLVFIWSCVCAHTVSYIENVANDEEDIENGVMKWLDRIENGVQPLRFIGQLFSFSLVFRFKVCFDRWWIGRKLWGRIVTNCLDLAMQAARCFSNPDIADEFYRYLIVYSYACMCILRNESLCDGNNVKAGAGVGLRLVKRGLLKQKELEELKMWEPHYCIDVLRELVVQAYMTKDSFYLEKVNIHSQLYRCFDNSIKNLNDIIGDCISVKAAGLPVSYDGIHLYTFFVYFSVAPIIWSASMSWVAVPMTMSVSSIVLCFIILGTKLLDPFGKDKVDIPIERFCMAIEEQICAIQDRAERKNPDRHNEGKHLNYRSNCKSKNYIIGFAQDEM